MARNFTASTDLAQNTAIPDHSTVGTIAFWIKPAFASGDGTNRWSVSWSLTAGTNAGDSRVGVQRFSDNNMYVGCYSMDVATGGTDDRLVFVDTGVFTSGTWASHVLTWNKSVTTTKYFVGGVQKGTTSTKPAASTVFSQACTVGAIGNTPSAWSSNITNNAAFADVAFYNVALTQGEISALAQGARPFNIRPAALQWYLPLDGLQSPEPDLSGFAHNGTLTGTTLASGPPVMQFTPRWPLNAPIVTAVSTGAAFQAAWAMNRNRIFDGVAT